MLRLYHYIHCPFCLRVRFALGYLNIVYESCVLNYDDEQTPIKLTGQKMLPIISDNGLIMNESLDIIKHLDGNNLLDVSNILGDPQFSELNGFLNQISKPLHNLCMPYWIYTQEFSESARQYFRVKKEKSRGSFKDLLKNNNVYRTETQDFLNKLEKDINPFWKHDKFSLYDILIASHLWGLYIVPEFQFNPKIHDYLQRIKMLCKFNYHEDFIRL